MPTNAPSSTFLSSSSYLQGCKTQDRQHHLTRERAFLVKPMRGPSNDVPFGFFFPRASDLMIPLFLRRQIWDDGHHRLVASGVQLVMQPESKETVL